MGCCSAIHPLSAIVRRFCYIDQNAIRTMSIEAATTVRAERLVIHDCPPRLAQRPRRLVVRYERKVENYLGFVRLACIRILLNHRF
jgi:hypothetical protein